ncbi:hypothetical protein M422DRAFT_29655 [Sphaerobolus stellatus SS14]|uniref:Uncharacterized protein n=1 Tax=Sphaerobolus stellatus (strain SS14) TaxID=990650 RepID=A0A0C9W365_SPHS4|nr:hypothetical protein M422DRAFT_29655 [Sphaerobolus stellatus SS14]
MCDQRPAKALIDFTVSKQSLPQKKRVRNWNLKDLSGNPSTAPHRTPMDILDLPTPGRNTINNLRNAFSPSQFPPRAVPTSPRQLVQAIRQLLSLSPPPPFMRLYGYHNRYATHQTTESYNVLLALSIRHNVYSQTRRLIRDMGSRCILPDAETERMVIRYLVSGGFWRDAWNQVMKRYSTVANIPTNLLLELLGSSIREYALPKQNRLKRPPRSLGRKLIMRRPPRRLVPTDALRPIFDRFATLPMNEVVKLPLRVVTYVVRDLIRTSREETALILTQNTIKGQAEELSPTRVRFLQDLINTHLSDGEINVATFEKKKKLARELFALHYQLRPNARTGFLISRYLAKSKNRGMLSYIFYKQYVAQWGPMVDSMDIRRRIVKYAVLQRKHGIAQEISELPPIGELGLPHGRSSEDLIPLRPWRSMYPQKGRKTRYWRRLFYRMLARRRHSYWRRGIKPQPKKKKTQIPPPTAPR